MWVKRNPLGPGAVMGFKLFSAFRIILGVGPSEPKGLETSPNGGRPTGGPGGCSCSNLVNVSASSVASVCSCAKNTSLVKFEIL